MLVMEDIFEVVRGSILGERRRTVGREKISGRRRVNLKRTFVIEVLSWRGVRSSVEINFIWHRAYFSP